MRENTCGPVGLPERIDIFKLKRREVLSCGRSSADFANLTLERRLGFLGPHSEPQICVDHWKAGFDGFDGEGSPRFFPIYRPHPPPHAHQHTTLIGAHSHRGTLGRGLAYLKEASQRCNEMPPPGTAPLPAAMGGRHLPTEVSSRLAQIEMEYQQGELTQRGYEIRRSRLLTAVDIENLNLGGDRPTTSGVPSNAPLPLCFGCVADVVVLTLRMRALMISLRL